GFGLAHQSAGEDEVGNRLDQIEHGAARAVGIFDKDRQRLQDIFANRANVGAGRTADRLDDQGPAYPAVVAGLPDRVSLQANHRFDARFAAAPPLDHALQALQSMEQIDFGQAAVVAEADDGFFKGRLARQLDLRHAPSDRE